MINALLNRYLKLEKPIKLSYAKTALKLGVDFSKQFKEIGDNVSFEYITSLGCFFSFDNGVINETLAMRRNEDISFPEDTLVLSEMDTSFILMKCCGDHEEIYWIAIEDIYNYCEGKPLLYNPITFPTFADFFSYLLDEEEKERAEDQ